MKEGLQIEYVSIDDIFPYENNAKIHTDEQIEEIANSIQEFGMIDPIGVWKNNEIIEGHGRLMACQKLGIKQVPIIRLDELTDEQRKAYALAHNKLTMNTDFDFDALQNELADLESIDMALFGFDVKTIEEEMDKDSNQVKMSQGTYQIIVDCDSEKQMEEYYDQITGLGIECRTSTL